MKKGITPVIALILLLLITISLVGFAFIFFNRLTRTATETTESQLEQQLQAQGKRIKIDNLNIQFDNTTLFIRGVGTSIIDSTELSIYVDDSFYTCNEAFQVSQNNVALCSINSTCLPDQIIKVTAPGNEDAEIC